MWSKALLTEAQVLFMNCQSYALGPCHGPSVLKPMSFDPETQLSWRKNTWQGSHQIFWTREPRLVCVYMHFLGITPPWAF